MNQFCTDESESCLQNSIRLVSVNLDKIGLQLELPEGFFPMEEDKQHRFYPRKGRPEIILENSDGIQITAQSFRQQIKSAQIRQAAEELCLSTKEMFPKYEISPVYLYTKGKLPIGWLLMKMSDSPTEHIKVLSLIKENVILLTITYPIKESIKWKSIIRQSFQTWKESK